MDGAELEGNAGNGQGHCCFRRVRQRGGRGRPDDGRTVKYYDIEAGSWWSFKSENLIAIY